MLPKKSSSPSWGKILSVKISRAAFEKSTCNKCVGALLKKRPHTPAKPLNTDFLYPIDMALSDFCLFINVINRVGGGD